jgi:hypothetical protein
MRYCISRSLALIRAFSAVLVWQLPNVDPGLFPRSLYERAVRACLAFLREHGSTTSPAQRCRGRKPGFQHNSDALDCKIALNLGPFAFTPAHCFALVHRAAARQRVRQDEVHAGNTRPICKQGK